jgi:hypothetical protein
LFGANAAVSPQNQLHFAPARVDGGWSPPSIVGMPRTRSDAGPTRLPGGRTLGKRLASAALVLSSTTLAFLGCASVLDIDHEYVLENSESSAGGSGSGKATGGKTGTGGASTGGVLASGGKTGSGGVAESGGGSGDIPDAACVENGPGCSADTKCCGGACVVPAPLVGCGNPTCAPCDMPPPFGTMICAAGACAIKCNPNYVLKNELCEPVSAGTGGVSGSGGAPSTGGVPAPACDAKLCPGCGAPGPFGCCKNDDQCGCSWTPAGGAYCL